MTWEEQEEKEIVIHHSVANDEICDECERPSTGAIFVTQNEPPHTVIGTYFKCTSCAYLWFNERWTGL